MLPPRTSVVSNGYPLNRPASSPVLDSDMGLMDTLLIICDKLGGSGQALELELPRARGSQPAARRDGE